MVKFRETNMSLNVSRAIDRLETTIGKFLKLDRSTRLAQEMTEIAIDILTELNIKVKIGIPRDWIGQRLPSQIEIWFTDRYQLERFKEALSLSNRVPEPKPLIREEDKK